MLFRRTPAGVVLSGALVILGALAFPASGAAQTIPGTRSPTRDAIRAEYISNILPGLGEVRSAWEQGIQEHDAEVLVTLYTVDAMVTPPSGTPAYGAEAIQAYWEEALPGMVRVQAGMGEIDASGQMAMVAGSYVLETRQETGAIRRQTGEMLTVYTQVGRRWFIRAQIFGTPDGQ